VTIDVKIHNGHFVTVCRPGVAFGAFYLRNRGRLDIKAEVTMWPKREHYILTTGGPLRVLPDHYGQMPVTILHARNMDEAEMIREKWLSNREYRFASDQIEEYMRKKYLGSEIGGAMSEEASMKVARQVLSEKPTADNGAGVLPMPPALPPEPKKRGRPRKYPIFPEIASGLKPLLTPFEVADRLKMSMQSLYKMRARKTGPRSLKVGGSLRYRQEDVEAYLKEREEQPMPQVKQEAPQVEVVPATTTIEEMRDVPPALKHGPGKGPEPAGYHDYRALSNDEIDYLIIRHAEAIKKLQAIVKYRVQSKYQP
jgi:predicted DNA-binding transcriptional regulator AlpA